MISICLTKKKKNAINKGQYLVPSNNSFEYAKKNPDINILQFQEEQCSTKMELVYQYHHTIISIDSHLSSNKILTNFIH